MIKDPKKLAQRMSILCILIGFIALAVGIIAMAMEQYIIAIAMGIVTVGQVWNYNKWKRVRSRLVFSAAHSILFTLVIWHLLIIYVNIMDWMKYGFSSLLTIH